MSEAIGYRDTVSIDEALHGVYRQLTDNDDSLNAPFRTMKDLFLWAACLGFILGERRQLVGKKVMIFRWTQFAPQTDVHILKAIAIATSEDANVLLTQDAILTMVEEYANAGIYELRSSLSEVYGQPLWNLVDRLVHQKTEVPYE